MIFVTKALKSCILLWYFLVIVVIIDNCDQLTTFLYFALIKGGGGAIEILKNAEALQRWMIVGPEISRIIADFESVNSKIDKHHEQTDRFQRHFETDV